MTRQQAAATAKHQEEAQDPHQPVAHALEGEGGALRFPKSAVEDSHSQADSAQRRRPLEQ